MAVLFPLWIVFCWLTWKITAITFKQNKLLYEICKLNLCMHSSTSCRHDAFRKENNPGEILLALWIFSTSKCFKFLLSVSSLNMRYIFPKFWAVILGGYILKRVPITVHISEHLSLFVWGFLKCLNQSHI